MVDGMNGHIVKLLYRVLLKDQSTYRIVDGDLDLVLRDGYPVPSDFNGIINEWVVNR